ncbi:amidohydrolase family protein [Jiangella mangrovi]|uniref:Putative TIM-barrel fold metal-dependent hydrolase n=1 Tax=Jiangella mangrovi TaxID=1524084 RepID=A0A7W9LPA9_9ACTN|nr:amidohydrolase family protein [Jiangella mangrovi]MBB5791203.1 putative TIM-barrel fold metal-dependent hydrolase [Jiangella mangrovi]
MNTVVDAHVAAGEHPSLPTLGVDALLQAMDDGGIERAVVGAVGRWVAVDNAEGNRTLAGWAQAHPDRLAFWATVSPWYGARACAELERAFADGACGLKLAPSVQGFGLLSPLLEPVLDVAEEHGRPVYVVTGVPVASEPLQLAELALRRPGLTFVMGRSGRTDFSLDLLPALTTGPNLVAETAYNGASLIATLVATLGADRVLFSSDAPFNDAGLELARAERAGLADADRAAVLGGSATKLLLGGGASR